MLRFDFQQLRLVVRPNAENDLRINLEELGEFEKLFRGRKGKATLPIADKLRALVTQFSREIFLRQSSLHSVIEKKLTDVLTSQFANCFFQCLVPHKIDTKHLQYLGHVKLSQW